MAKRIAAAMLICSALLPACGRESLDDGSAEALHYTAAEEQQRLKEALSKAGTPYEIRHEEGDREEIWYDRRFKADVDKVRGELFGVPPPMGRSVSLDPTRMAALEKEFHSRNIKFHRHTFKGDEFISWEPIDDGAADAALQTMGLRPEFLVEMQKMRRYSDSQEGRVQAEQ